ncbi:MAG: hypothetical protein ACRC42_03205 [Mycoplasma sp.]
MGANDIFFRVVVPIITSLVGIFALITLLSSYILIFRLRKYIKKMDTYFENMNRLTKTFGDANIKQLKSPVVNYREIEINKNRELIDSLLGKIKSSDLKDIILGTYAKEFAIIKNIASQCYFSPKHTKQISKFLRLFHIQTQDGVEIRFLDDTFNSFFKIDKSSIEVSVIKKEIYSQNMTADEFYENASVYTISFTNKKYTFKNVSNPLEQFDKKLEKRKGDYQYATSKKMAIYNVYLKKNFKNLSKIKKTFAMSRTRTDRYIYERASQKVFNKENEMYSEKVRILKKKQKYYIN